MILKRLIRNPSLAQGEEDPCAGKEVSYSVSNGNELLPSSKPSLRDQMPTWLGGLEDQQILNQNAFFEDRYSGWTDAMFETASNAGQSLSRYGDTGLQDGIINVNTNTNLGQYGDEQQSHSEGNHSLGSFSFIIDRVYTSESGTSWQARVRVLDNTGFDLRNRQGRTPILSDIFESRYVRRATWYVNGDCE